MAYSGRWEEESGREKVRERWINENDGGESATEKENASIIKKRERETKERKKEREEINENESERMNERTKKKNMWEREEV